MKLTIFILFWVTVLILSGCYTERKARQEMSKAHLNYPSILPELCADLFPVTEITIQGDTVFVTDTVFDAIFFPSDTTILNDTVRIVKTLPGKTVTITNTVTRVDTIIQKSTAEIAACSIARDGAIKLANDNAATAAKWKKRATLYGFSALGLILVIGVWTYFKIKGK